MISLGSVPLYLEKGLLCKLFRLSHHLCIARLLLIVVTHHQTRLFLNLLYLLCVKQRSRHIWCSLFAFSQANLVVR